MVVLVLVHCVLLSIRFTLFYLHVTVFCGRTGGPGIRDAEILARLAGHYVEAAQRHLEAAERYPVGSKDWAELES